MQAEKMKAQRLAQAWITLESIAPKGDDQYELNGEYQHNFKPETYPYVRAYLHRHGDVLPQALEGQTAVSATHWGPLTVTIMPALAGELVSIVLYNPDATPMDSEAIAVGGRVYPEPGVG